VSPINSPARFLVKRRHHRWRWLLTGHVDYNPGVFLVSTTWTLLTAEMKTNKGSYRIGPVATPPDAPPTLIYRRYACPFF